MLNEYYYIFLGLAVLSLIGTAFAVKNRPSLLNEIIDSFRQLGRVYIVTVLLASALIYIGPKTGVVTWHYISSDYSSGWESDEDHFGIKIINVYLLEGLGFALAFILPIIPVLQGRSGFTLRQLILTYPLYIGISFTLIYFSIQYLSLPVDERIWNDTVIFRPTIGG